MAKTSSKKFLIGVSIAGLFVLVILLSGIFILRPQIASWLGLSAPTPQCLKPSLTIGNSDFDIQFLAPLTDGSFAIPYRAAHTAFWLQGTNTHFVFGLSAIPVNEILMELYQIGDVVKVTWADCGEEDYVVTSIEKDVALDATFFDQSEGGISVYIPGNSNAASIVLLGKRPELLVTSSPEPTDVNAVLMDILFIENSISTDKKIVTFVLGITNRGAHSISLVAGSLDLTPANETPLTPLQVSPALPLTIPSGSTVTLQVDFPYPGPPSAVFRIADQTMEFYYP
jgi:hypothetical protein